MKNKIDFPIKNYKFLILINEKTIISQFYKLKIILDLKF